MKTITQDHLIPILKKWGPNFFKNRFHKKMSFFYVLFSLFFHHNSWSLSPANSGRLTPTSEKSKMSEKSETQEMTNQEKFKYVFQKLNKDTMHLIDEFYHQDIEFHDPVGTIHGAKNMKLYYENMYKNVKTIRFDFSQFVESGDTIIGVWVMTLVTDKLNGGKPILLDGTSVIRFQEGKAIYHRDYFDMGAFIYEHIPVLGMIIKKIRSQFKVHE